MNNSPVSEHCLSRAGSQLFDPVDDYVLPFELNNAFQDEDHSFFEERQEFKQIYASPEEDLLGHSLSESEHSEEEHRSEDPSSSPAISRK